MIETATQEQWDEIEQIRLRAIASTTDTIDFEEAERAVRDVWKMIGRENEPTVMMAQSPVAAVQLWRKTMKGMSGGEPIPEVRWYFSSWWRVWTAWYDGAEVLGVKFDQEKKDLLARWAKNVLFCTTTGDLVCISQNPVEVNWNDDGELHCEDGMSVRFGDGVGIWSIDGVSVNEQIVMRPETQTIADINDEPNEEVRRIRIERFGWSRYLEESDSKVIDTRRNDIENTYEILASTPHGMNLVTHCPSTGRRYSLGLPEEVETCEQAQRLLWGDIPGARIIART